MGRILAPFGCAVNDARLDFVVEPSEMERGDDPCTYLEEAATALALFF